MKHSEKAHLKENEVATALAVAGQNRSRLVAIGAGVLVVLVAIGSFVTWQRNKDSAVSGLLADAMVIYEAPVQAPVPGDAGSTAAPTQMPGTRSPGGNEPSWRSVSPVGA